MRRNFEDYFVDGLGLCIVLLLAAIVAFGIYYGGWVAGAWPMSCKFDSSQPKCVQAGWGTHNDVTVKGQR